MNIFKILWLIVAIIEGILIIAQFVLLIKDSEHLAIINYISILLLIPMWVFLVLGIWCCS